jgi:hypothetical protein
MNTNQAFLEQQSQTRKISTLYYPGAGKDFKTLSFIAENTALESAFFADYASEFRVTADMLLKAMPDWIVENSAELGPDFLRQNSWTAYWYDLGFATEFANPANAYITKYQLLHKPSGKSIDFYYLGTEAIKTYQLLLENGITPDVLVLQDHGWGSNWSTFGGSSILNSIAQSFPLPLLLIGENTEPWPGYEKRTDFEGNFGSAGHPRAFFIKE